jgi:hypothetical protein
MIYSLKVPPLTKTIMMQKIFASSQNKEPRNKEIRRAETKTII